MRTRLLVVDRAPEGTPNVETKRVGGVVETISNAADILRPICFG